MSAPTNPPANVLTMGVGGVEYPLAVGLNRFGHYEVAPANVDAGLAMFMHWWRPWCDPACILEDQLAFVGWVVPS